MTGILLVLLLSFAVALPGAAQDDVPPWEGGVTRSLSQPPRARWHSGASFGGVVADGKARPLGYGLFGVEKSLTNPVTGILSASLEGYAGFRGDLADGGVRALLSSTTFRLTGGVDFNLRDLQFRPLLGLTMPVRRAGIFGSGTLLRLEWSPGPSDAVRASVLVPVGQPLAGRTRQRESSVAAEPQAPRLRLIALPDDSPGLAITLTNLVVGMRRLQSLLVPDIDAPTADPYDALEPLVAELLDPPALPGVTAGPGLNTEGIIRAYHAHLEQAFSVAATGRPVELGEPTAVGRRLADMARETLLDHVIIPFDRLLGRWKSPDLLDAFGRQALGNFARGLVFAAVLPEERERAALYVFQQTVEAIVAIQREAVRDWGDSRVLWIPLQLALLPEDHVTQAQLDALIERAVGQPFSDGNRVWYVINEQFQEEVSRSIRVAEDYHVLWIHDFRGRNSRGEPDRMSLRYVVDAYLRALTERVRRYDTVGRLPVYMILLDQHYYEVNRGRLWLDFLENPLGDLPPLPGGFEEFETRLRAAQDTLREAVAGSRLLASEAREYGDRWFRNQIKIHVSITNPADPSFWSRDIVPLIGIPDNVMRDHRKIVFYDITEDDPYRGMAIYTGMGIGEHYSGPTWEDRSIMAQGPAVLTLKHAVRQLFLAHGLRPEETPYALRARPLAEDYAAKVAAEIARQEAAGRSDQRAMELHNETGFGDKRVNVAKALLYTLMPPGSVIKVPDSLWGSSVFASMLAGSALRGARVLFIAPSLDSAPSSGWPAMGLAHDLFSRLIVLQQALGPELEAAGGLLKTGIYNPGVGVQDFAARFDAAYRNGRRTPFLRRLLPLDPTVDSLLVQIGSTAAPPASGADLVTPPDSVVPQLHLKANFFASREGWDLLVASPTIEGLLRAYYMQLVRYGLEGGPDARAVADALAGAGWQLVAETRARLDEEARKRMVYYLLVGSANQDYRSMFMDGEASVLLSGWSGIVGLIDFGLLINLSVWVDDLALLDALLPPPSGFRRSIARTIRPAL